MLVDLPGSDLNQNGLMSILVDPGGTERPEGFCEEANQTEPTRQHQQQGEEEDEELHDDETESERQNKRQTLLQRQTGKLHLFKTEFSFLNISKNVSNFIDIYFLLLFRLPYGMHSWKRGSSTDKIFGLGIFFIPPTIMYISVKLQYIYTLEINMTMISVCLCVSSVFFNVFF